MENNNVNIDEAYDNLMKMGDGEKLTEDQINQIKLAAASSQKAPSTDLMQKIENGEIDFDQFSNDDDEVMYANIDPVTGKPKAINAKAPSSDYDLDDFFDAEEEFKDVEDMEISDESVKKALETKFGNSVQDSDAISIIQLVKDYQDGKKIGYDDLPRMFKNEIAKTIMNANNSIYTGNKELKDQMARSFIDAISNESIINEINQIHTDLASSINNYVEKEIGAVVTKSNESQRDILQNKILEIANNIEKEKPEDAKRLRDVNKAFIESYTYESMKKMLKETGKLRVKKIEIEKPMKVYQDFNMKYAKSKMTIQDISMLEPILDRNLPSHINMDDIRKFLISFCKYCRNFKAENIVEHTFMYYFIMNIRTLDIYNKDDEKEKEFYGNLINNISNFIDLIVRKEENRL